MAHSSAECEEMIRVSYETGKKLMVGQCLRFDSSYLFLKECIDSKKYGPLRNLFMDRLSAYPKWGADKWYESTEKCGGCILDTHIHDIDMARFLWESLNLRARSHMIISRVGRLSTLDSSIRILR